VRNLTANASIEDTAPRGSRVREFVTGAEVRTRGGCERTVRILIREGLKPASGQERSVGAENSDRLRKTKEHTRKTGVRGTQRTSAVEGTLSISRVAARLKPRRDERTACARHHGVTFDSRSGKQSGHQRPVGSVPFRSRARRRSRSRRSLTCRGSKAKSCEGRAAAKAALFLVRGMASFKATRSWRQTDFEVWRADDRMRAFYTGVSYAEMLWLCFRCRDFGG
jgi:hypothetical protein